MHQYTLKLYRFHFLSQNHTVDVFHVGDHNILLLEGGDWNDTLDMAREKGESVCFHSFYSNNLNTLAKILKQLEKNGIKEIALLKEILILLDHLPDQSHVNYNSPESKQNCLNKYFEKVKQKVSGKKILVKIKDLIKDLETKAEHIRNHIREKEWIKTKE
ncbi:MAG: cellobiose phosphorylase, partial [bacterium]|nr:cellobiose phosphorylase [bacterium]